MSEQAISGRDAVVDLRPTAPRVVIEAGACSEARPPEAAPAPDGPAADLSQLRMALVHEWLDLPGGAEQVLAAFHRTFPDADIWSLWSRKPASTHLDGEVHTSWLARTPLAGHKALSLPVMPLAWRTLPAADYDVVVTSSYAFAPAARFRGSQAVSMHYVHTPGRYWWTPDLDSRGIGPFGGVLRGTLSGLDRRIARGHRHVAANSAETRDRIRRFWGIDATVIHPPVDTAFYRPGPLRSAPPFETYLLGVSRWIPYKRLDLVIATGEKAGLPVVIAGSGPLESELRARANTARVPVLIEKHPTRERLRDLYRGALATVFPVHEDFGIVPVESMGCGTPVVGVAAGGLLETVEHGSTGRLAPSADPLLLSYELHDLPARDPQRLHAHAEGFSAERFQQATAQWVAQAVRS